MQSTAFGATCPDPDHTPLSAERESNSWMTSGCPFFLACFTKQNKLMQLSRRVGEIRLELGVVVLAEAGRDEGAGLRRANGLARAGLGENDVPEVGVW